MNSTDTLDDRLDAAVTELAAASEALDRSALQAGGTRAEAIDYLRSTWASIDKTDRRWTAINALLMLDQENCHAGEKPEASLVALHGSLVSLGAALLDIDADLGEGDIRWLHMRQLRIAIDALPALYAALEDELAAVTS